MEMKQKIGNGQSESTGNSENQSNESNTNEQEQNGEDEKIKDDHSMWEEAFRALENGTKEEKNSNRQQTSNKSQEDDRNQELDKHKGSNEENSMQSSKRKNNEIKFEFNERIEFEKNRREVMERAKNRFGRTKREIRGEQNIEESIKLGNIGESRNEIDWKLLLRREVEKSETIWSQRRSVAENNYAYRLEENDVDEEAETEVMIDISGSVDLELVKAFLRDLKPIIKQSKLKVGCFNEKFWGLVEVKTIKDIDNFTIPKEARYGRYAWTEDWDLAVRSFSRKSGINKIVFTDGEPCPGTMPKDDLKRENVIWMVYGNKDFKPCCGKVIDITEKQLRRLHQIEQIIEQNER